MAISPVADPPDELPYLTDSMLVNEEAAGPAARMKELRPRDSGSMTVVMQQGTYIFLRYRRALRDGHADNRHCDRVNGKNCRISSTR